MEIGMSIRTSLILSHLTLVVLITLGMLVGAELVGDKLLQKNLAFAEQGVKKITAANLQLSEKILTKYGEFSVEDIADFLARELSTVLAGQKTFNYHKMRRNPALRRLAVQNICTP